MAPTSPFGGAIYIKASKQAPCFSLEDPLPFFRKEFRITEPILQAELLLQSPGFGKFYLNGRDVSEDLFISATSDYDKILWYNVYDVTALLQEGCNVLGAIAGNGFFNESFQTGWDYDKAPWRDAPQILVALRVNGKTVAVSDTTWRVSTAHSHILFSHLRSGEYVDMRKYDPAWLLPGYDDSAWGYALPRQRPLSATLRPVPCQPVREFESYPPASVCKAADGAYLVDFGIMLSGYAELTVCEPRGTEIRLHYAEELDAAGKPKHNRMDGPRFYPESPFALCKLIASGGSDCFKPLFFYHGFRYLRIEGLSKAPSAETLRAIFVHQAVERRAEFACGNDVLNFIYRAGIRSTYCNLFWCMTDCPTREKLGWTNDAQASTEQALINFDILPLFEKWFEDIKASMFEDGSLHGTVPAPDWAWGHRCGPVCDCLLYEMPYRVYLYTGKAQMLLDGIPYFKRYLAFLEKKLADGYEFELGDWTASSALASGVPKRFIWEMHLLKAYAITALAHRVAGSNAGVWEAKQAALCKQLEKAYLDPSGRCSICEQTAIAMLLQLGVGCKQVLAEQLVSVVERDGCQLRSGMVGIQYIYHALSEIGRADLALRLLSESDPGYLTWYKRGESTLWEVWNGFDRGSHNHHMLSGVIAWFFRSLLGITPLEDSPGFAEIALRPCFLRELGFARGSMDTVQGRIEAEWHCERDGFVYQITIPQGVCASFRGRRLTPGTHRLFVAEN